MHFPLTQNGATPLIVAGHSDVVNILIRNGAGVNMAANVRQVDEKSFDLKEGI